MAAEPNGPHVELAEDGEVLARADVEPVEDDGVVHASLHAQSGHQPTGTRTRLVDAVLELPEIRQSNRLEATVPLGDTESLDRLRERCDEVQTRPAGASCLVDAALPTDAAAAPGGAGGPNEPGRADDPGEPAGSSGRPMQSRA